MRLLLQRVLQASVTIDGTVVGEIGPGLLVLVGLGAGDTEAMIDQALEKMLTLRIFSDVEGKMNKSVEDINGGVLAVSQFTLYADARKGRRPSYTDALSPAEAKRLYELFLERLAARHKGPTASGIFAADMKVSLVNDGPVTIWLDSAELGWSGTSPASRIQPAKV